jgi:hypothetical protein
LVWS